MKLRNIYYLLFVFVAVKVIFFITKSHFVIWDEAVYLGLGKYIYSLGHVGLWENIRPLGLPLLLGSLWLLKLNYLLLADILELGFSLGCIYLTYRIARLYLSENLAVLAALIFMATPVFFYNSLLVLTEIPSTFFILLSTYCFIRKKYIFVGLFLGVSFLFKYPSGIILIAFLLSLLFGHIAKKDFRLFFYESSKIVLFFFLAILPILVFNYILYGSVFSSFVDASAHQNNPLYEIKNPFLNVFFFPVYLFLQNPFLVFSLLGVYYFIKSRRLVFLFLILVPLLYVTSILNKQLRFSILFLPFLAILSSLALSFLYNKLKSLMLHRISFFVILLVLVFITISSDFVEYEKFPDETPAMVDELYSFFPQGLEGKILTSDPLFAAYTDLSYTPYYMSNVPGNSVYSRYVSSSVAIVYAPYAFPCINDTVCASSKLAFERGLESNFTAVFSKDYYGKSWRIYLNKNYYDLSKEAGQMVITALPSVSNNVTLEDLFDNYFVSGFIYMDWPNDILGMTPSDIKIYSENLQKRSVIPLFIASDIEGGEINRISSFFPINTNQEYGAEFENSKDKPQFLESYNNDVNNVAEELRYLGINLNLAPVVDVEQTLDKGVLSKYGRSYSTRKDTVSLLGAEYVKALESNRIFSTIKHFPGHGHTSCDTYFKVCGVVLNETEYRATDLYPFAEIVNNSQPSFVMVGLFTTPYDPENISVCSSKVVSGILKDELNFSGIIISDDIMMGATKDMDRKELTIKAINAGVDIILTTNPDDMPLIHSAIIDGVNEGRINRERIDYSFNKIVKMKANLG